MPEKTFDVKYSGIFGSGYKYLEEFSTPTGVVKVQFDRETGIAKNVPETIALRLCKSEAFEIVGKDVPTKKEKNLETSVPLSEKSDFEKSYQEATTQRKGGKSKSAS